VRAVRFAANKMAAAEKKPEMAEVAK